MENRLAPGTRRRGQPTRYKAVPNLQNLHPAERSFPPLESAVDASGGRTWWAHLQFTRINIEPTFLEKEIEEDLNILDAGTFFWAFLMEC
jgi:hypothetical protein